MCGIIGYNGDREAQPVLLNGLARLEYRGYDSAGISLHDACGITSVRAVGNLDALRREAARLWLTPPSARVGIAHTRWATHGGVSTENAHPHTNCDGAVHIVLNGIVENYQSLRDDLLRRGCRFTSDTDAEVVAHLVGRHLKTGLSLTEAVRAAYRSLRGHYAFLVMHRDEPGSLVAARNECPMVVGLGARETFVASALAAFPVEIDRMLMVGDHEIVTVLPESVGITTASGEPVRRAVEHVSRHTDTVDMAGHSSFMRKEINEQGAAVATTVRAHLGRSPLAGSVSDEQLRRAPRITVVGCGTSYHAALVGRILMERWAGVPVTASVSSEWVYSSPILAPGELVIGVTQSGETRDTLAALRLARELEAASVALTNVSTSQATREADALLLTHAGLEVGVAATKTFTTQVVAFALLALRLGELRGTLGAGFVSEMRAELCRLPAAIEETLADTESAVADTAAGWSGSDFFMYLGRDLGYPVALEGALKMKEISYVPSDAYPAGEMKHGPIALLSAGAPVVCVATDSPVMPKLLSNLAEVRARGATALVVASAGQHRVRDHADAVCWLPPMHADLQPLLACLPLQLLALGVAEARGLNVDQPRNLAKTVTVE